MTIIHVRPNDDLRLQGIASLFNGARKVVTVTGAGISTNAGIPVSIISPFPAHLSPGLGLSIKKRDIFSQPSPVIPFVGSLRSGE
jgi:hypothetical protein